MTDVAPTTLSGEPTTLADYTDGPVLIVDVASKCVLTPQYTALEMLAQDYGNTRSTLN